MSFLDKLFDQAIATDLGTTGGEPVNVGDSAPPTGAGQVLVTTDAEHAVWTDVGDVTGEGLAQELATTGAPVNVSGSLPPATGQALVAVDSTHAQWTNVAYPGSAIPAAVGVAGSAGTSPLMSRGDHIHAHGEQTDETMHAVATAAADGFMSKDHVVKLDGITEGADPTFPTLGDAFVNALRVDVVLDSNLTPLYGNSSDIDGVGGGTEILVLAVSQSDDSENGFWSTYDGYWPRPPGFPLPGATPIGQLVIVDNGNTYAGSMWVYQGGNQWDQITPGSPITGGDGITRDGNALNMDPLTDTAHGARGGGTLHADATTTVSGFFSGAEKVKLSGIATGAAAVGAVAASQITVTTATAGVSTTAARADHVHSVSVGTPSSLTLAGANAGGSSNQLARADHIHALPGTASPATLTVGGSNVAGVSTAIPRADHVHALPAFGSASGTFCQGSDSRLSDDRVASALRTASNTVNVSAAAVPTAGQVLCANGATAAVWATPAFDPAVNGLRLSHTADDSAGSGGAFSTVYLAHATSNAIALFDTTSSRWFVYTAAGTSGAISYAVTGRTTGVPFDVFAYWTGSAVALEVLNWTDATTRATALFRVNGVWTKTGDASRRYLGTVRPRSATTYQMRWLSDWSTAPAGLDIWNVDNRRQAQLTLNGVGANWVYTTATTRQANGNANAQIDTLSGLANVDPITVAVRAMATGTSTGTGDNCMVAIGQNNGSLSPNGLRGLATVIAALGTVGLHSMTCESVQLGVGAFKWLERGSGAGTVTWLGNSAAENQPGMTAAVWW